MLCSHSEFSPNRSFNPPNVSISEFQVHYKLRLNSILRCSFAVFPSSFPRGLQMVNRRGWLDWVGGMAFHTKDARQHKHRTVPSSSTIKTRRASSEQQLSSTPTPPNPDITNLSYSDREHATAKSPAEKESRATPRTNPQITFASP